MIIEFFKLVQKVFLDYSAGVFLTPRNHGYLESLLDYCLNLIKANLDDQFCNKYLLNILQSLQIQLNGVQPQQLQFLQKRPSTANQQYGSSSLYDHEGGEQMLQDLNSQLIRLACVGIFKQNPTKLDGATQIKKFGEIIAVFLAMQVNPIPGKTTTHDFQQTVEQQLVAGLWEFDPALSDQQKQESISQILNLCDDYIRKKQNTATFHAKIIQKVKEMQTTK